MRAEARRLRRVTVEGRAGQLDARLSTRRDLAVDEAEARESHDGDGGLEHSFDEDGSRFGSVCANDEHRCPRRKGRRRE